MVQFLREAIAKKEEDLLCPVCLEPSKVPIFSFIFIFIFIEPSKVPIFSCPDSHIICSTCVPKLRSQECPQCRRRVKLPDTLRRDRFAEKTAREYEELLKRLAKLTGPTTSLDTKLTGLQHHEEPPKPKLDHHEELPKPKLGETEFGHEENEVDGKEEEGGAWSEDQRGDFGTLIFENTAKIRPLLFRKSKTPKYSH